MTTTVPTTFNDRVVTTLSNWNEEGEYDEIVYVGIRSEMDRMPDELWPQYENLDSMVYPDPASARQGVIAARLLAAARKRHQLGI